MAIEDADLIRVAVVSDVHGNLAAFRRMLDELDARGPFEFVVGGGDYAAGGLYPAECLWLVREHGFDCVRGNTDEWIVEAATDGRVPARDYKPADKHEGVLAEMDRWAVERLSPTDIEFLTGLPLEWRIVGPSGQRLAFVHATPWSAHATVMPNDPEEVANTMLDQAEADVLIYGHIHRAYIRPLGDRTLACAGSVGLPMDGDQRPCILIATDEGDGWELEHVRVAYDGEAYARELLASTMPNAPAFAERVRTAR